MVKLIYLFFLGLVHLMEGSHKFISELSSVKKHHQLYKG